MPVESAADRLAFLDTDEFGTEATYTPFMGSPTTIQGIFSKETVEVDLDGTTVPTALCTFTCRTADVPDKVIETEPKSQNQIVIDGTTYKIRSWSSLEGMTEMILARNDG